MKKILLIMLLSVTIFAKYVVINNPVYTNIYSIDNKIPVIGIVHLTWSIVKLKIKRRNNFHQNKILPKETQATNSNYHKSGYDKGHFSASNADWDNNKSNMSYTFAFTNMTPQYFNTNRRSYVAVENYGRRLTKKYLSVFVINIAVPSNTYIAGHVNVPSVYYKIFMYNNTKECYRIPNDNKLYRLQDMKIGCSKIAIPNL